MVLYLFCLKLYFSNKGQVNVDEGMFQNVIEIAKTERSKTLCNILEKIDLTSNGGKQQTGDKPRNNESKQKNDRDIGNDTFYLTKTIRKFITNLIEKEKKNVRSITKSSLYYLLGQGSFHKKTDFVFTQLVRRSSGCIL